MVHSLDYFSFLKVDPLNLTYFSWSNPKSHEIQIQQEFQEVVDGYHQTNYLGVYNIRLHPITLRELLMLQSFYMCTTHS